MPFKIVVTNFYNAFNDYNSNAFEILNILNSNASVRGPLWVYLFE
jgi:hypothetical protein